MPLDTLSFIAFLAAMAVFVVLDRKSIEAQAIFLIRRTKRGRNFIINTGRRFHRFWTWVGNIAVVTVFIASIIGVYNLLLIFLDIVANMRPAVGVGGLVIPSPVAVAGGGFIGVPLWYWLISVLVLMCVHEGMHGIMAASQKMKIKNLGWILLLVLPMGAFVEPDEKDVARKKPMAQLRFFAAGSFANFVTAFLIAFIIAPMIFTAVTVPAEGVHVFPQKGYPFANSTELRQLTDHFNSTMNPKFFVRSIDGRTVSSVDGIKEVFAAEGIMPGDYVSLNMDIYYGDNKDNVDIMIQAVSNPENKTKAYIGILMFDEDAMSKQLLPSQSIMTFRVVSDGFIPYRRALFFLHELLLWMFFLNLGIGLFNALPLSILDGKRMWDTLLKRIVPRRSKKIMRAVEWITLVILLVILLPAILSNFI